jgi:hypothetical protein
MKRFAIAIALAAALGGCSSSPISEHSNLVPGTMVVQPIGNSYSILALVETRGGRVPMKVLATRCEKKHGDILKADSLWDAYEADALLNGPAAKDQLFTQLCNEGMPVANAMEERLTPEQRAARERAVNQVVGQTLLEHRGGR